MSADVLEAIRAADRELERAAYLLAATKITKGDLEPAQARLRRAALRYAREASRPFRMVDRKAREEGRDA